MSQDLTRNQKLLAAIGVLLIAGFMFNGKLFNSSTKVEGGDGASTKTKNGLADVVVDGDADSTVDTIRRLKETTRQAVQAAQNAQAETAEYKITTGQKLDALASTIADDKKATDDKISSGFGDLRKELGSFKTLLNGELHSKVSKPKAPDSQPAVTDWARIGPINTLPTTLKVGDESSNRENIAYSINDGFLLSDTASAQNSVEPLITPVATIPENSPLLHSVTLSTLIGRVPKQGQVTDPFNFYIQTGSENWTSQDHQIPFIERAIWRGVATGDKDLECVRGVLTSVTFVFTDETILTVPASRDDPLAELVTPTGSNCVPGTFVSNTAKYLAAFGIGGALAGLGEGISSNETLTSLTDGGSIISAVNGNTGNFLAGRALSTSANRAAEIINDEYQNSFSSVIMRAGVDINMITLKQINIDHNSIGRKVTYADPNGY